MKAATLAEAREAKDKLSREIGKRAGVNGVGIARSGRGYTVKVNLVKKLRGRALPSEIDGVPVKVEVIGAISKRPAAAAKPAQAKRRAS